MSNSAAAEPRRSTRLSISVPIVIHGKDAQQKPFRESTRTLILNKHGAKIVTAQQLVIGAEILIEHPALGSVAKANVVWVSPKRDTSGLRQAGVQLKEAQNIWGLEFPPDDWTAEEEEEEAPAVEAAPSPSPAPAEVAPAPTSPRASTQEDIAAQFLEELREAAEAQCRQFSARLEQVTAKIGLEWETGLRDRAGAARVKELAAMEKQVHAANERLDELKAQLENLNAKIAESQLSMYAALENVPPPLTAEQIHERIEADALPVLHLITEGGIAAARERIQAQAQAEAGQALANWKTHLQTAKDAQVEDARQQITLASTSALEALKRESDAGLEELKRRIREEVRENAEKVAAQIKSKLDEVAESQRDALVARLNETVRETGERQAKLLATQLDALLVSRLDQAQRRAQSISETLQTSVEDGLRGVGEKSSRELQARLQEIADTTIAASSRQVQKQVEEAAGAAAEKDLQVWQERLEEIGSKTVTSSSDQIRAQVEASGKAAAEQTLAAWQKRLEEITDKTVASSSDRVRARIEESAQAAAEKALPEWQAKLQEATDRAAALWREQVQQQINEALKLMGPKLKEMQERAVEDALEAFRSRLSQFLGMLHSGGNK